MEPVTNKTIERLKYGLVREGFLSYDDLMCAEEAAKINKMNLAQILIGQEFITEEALLRFIEAKLHVPYVNLDDYTLDVECLKFISAEDAKKHRIIPLFKIEDVLTVAMADPLDLFIINELIKSINLKIEPIICSERNILEGISKHYSLNAGETSDATLKVLNWEDCLNSEKQDQEQANIIIRSILEQAFYEKAQEIYFEPVFNGLAVQFKIDKTVHARGTIPILLMSTCIFTLKISAGLNAHVSEIPQLGRLYLAGDKVTLNASVATFPTSKGERVTVRVYSSPKPIDDMLSSEEADILRFRLESPGVFFVFGSDEAFNISAVYSMLAEPVLRDKKIFTIESILKYEMNGVVQSELNEKVGFDISKAVKHIDMQSPDVVYIEEVFSNEAMEYVCYLASKGKIAIVQTCSCNLDRIKSKASVLGIDLQKVVSCCIEVSGSSACIVAL